MQKLELNKERRLAAINDLKTFFANEKNEDISDFQAGLLLDFMINSIGPYLYNQAIEDAYQLMREKVEDLYGLEKRRFK